jgi:hypothetical protein
MMPMPFESQPDRDDESAPDDFELALSPTLGALADRLNTDADSIAARYPSEASPALGAEFWELARQAMNVEGPSPSQPDRAGRSRRWMVIASSAAAACVLLTALVTWQLTARQLTENAPTSGVVAQGDPRATPAGAEPESVLRVNILKGLSSAEQEAVLDLLDRQSPIESSFSI